MSSVVTAPEGSASRPSRTTPPSRGRRSPLSGDALLGVLGAIGLSVVVFVARGGNDMSANLAANTWVQGGLVLLAGAAAITAVLIGGRGRAWGGGALAAFAALAALTYASIAWSVQPADSWVEANRTLSYLAAFAVALILARVAPGRWRAAIGAVALAATVACAYSLLVKVFPATLDPRDPYGRLQAPFDYWNAVGLMGAIGLPACLWAGAHREPAPVVRALAVPALAVLVSAIVLSFSRGAVLVALIGLVVWFALAPLRLRSALVLLLGAAGGAAISAWGSAHRGISADHMASAVRVSAGHDFGVVIVVTLALSAVAALAAMLALDRITLSAAIRRRLGGVLIGLVALAPVAGLAALAASHRGFGGEVSHLWNRLTNTNGGFSDRPGRLVQLSNSRPHYWSVAIKVGEHHPLAGAGALGFATAQTRYGGSSRATYVVTHAHGYVVETFADFGAIGLAVSLWLLLAWMIATGRTLELSGSRGAEGPRAPPAPGPSAERTGLVAMLAIVLVFGVHSALDWTWFVPGVAVIALACAGWLAGRGPVSRPVGRLARRRELSRAPGAVGALGLVAALALSAVWVIVQPLRSSDSYLAAIAAAANGNAGAALTDARSSAAEDPVWEQPLFLLAQLESAVHDGAAARRALTDAVSRQPANPQTWEQLGCYDLRRRSQAQAQIELHRALVLEPAQSELASDPAAFCLTATA